MAGQPGVRVVNPSEGRPFKGKYDGEVYQIQPGQEVYTSWEAACLWLGNPNLKDEGTQRNRRDALERLATKYGVYENDYLWDSQRPTIRVHSLDGDRITMLLDDPDGDSILPDIQTKRENDLVESRLQQMEREMLLLRKRLRAKGEDVDEPELQSDDPVGPRAEPQVGVLGQAEDEEVDEDRPDRIPAGGN